MKSKTLATAKMTLALSGVWAYIMSSTYAVACKIGGSIEDAQSCVKTPGPSDATLLIPKVVNILLFAAGSLSIFIIIYAGMTFILSAGDDKKVGSAVKTIINALIGLAIIVSAYTIVNFVTKNVLGI